MLTMFTKSQQRESRDAELARRAGMKQHAVSRFEAGDVVPTLTTLDRIASALESHLAIDFAA